MNKLQPTFLSELIEQILDRIEKRISTLTDKQFTSKEFIELHCVFKEEVLNRALEIIDNKLVISYRPESGISELIEITGVWSSPVVYKLLPNINFCRCNFFTQHILNAIDKSYYTCEHVLAARLARILGKLKVEVLPKHKFNFILKQIAAD